MNNLEDRLKALLYKWEQEIIHLEAIVRPIEQYYNNGLQHGALKTLKQKTDEIRQLLEEVEENT